MNTPYDTPQSESRAWKAIRVQNIRLSNHAGSVKAYADVRLETDIGGLAILGLAVVSRDGKSPWVAFPQKPGKTRGKWFPIIEADGKLRELIVAAVLDAYVVPNSKI